jgi:hypothetical protein
MMLRAALLRAAQESRGICAAPPHPPAHACRFETAATGDLNMRQLAAGDVLQLERKGYYIVDKPAAGGQPAVLFSIPDGRTKNMAK